MGGKEWVVRVTLEWRATTAKDIPVREMSKLSDEEEGGGCGVKAGSIGMKGGRQGWLGHWRPAGRAAHGGM